METIVASFSGHAHKLAWVAMCDFRDNKEITDSYFDEADMNG
jgi:hypothetical protein